jgi:Cupin-like domain
MYYAPITGEPLIDSGTMLAHAYPQTSCLLRHRLGDHPALSIEALAAAAALLPSEQVEVRIGNAEPGGDFVHADRHRASATEIIAAIGNHRCWVMLANPQALPDYAALHAELVAALTPVIATVTGAMVQPQMFIFISSPGTHTPLHLDSEYNILFQITGSKIFSMLPSDDGWITAQAHEAYHRNGDNMLRWDGAIAEAATAHIMHPGDALYVPYKSPHWVDVADAVSVSLSFTWKSAWSCAQEDAWRMNARLRSIGLDPAPPAHWPRQSPVKTLSERALRRIVGR